MHGTATSKPRMLPMNLLSMLPNSTLAGLDGTNEAVLGHAIWQTSMAIWQISFRLLLSVKLQDACADHCKLVRCMPYSNCPVQFVFFVNEPMGCWTKTCFHVNV